MTWVAAGIASGAATMAGVQYIKGKRDQKKDEARRPVYTMPGEIGENLNQAKASALEGLPESSKQEYLSNLERGSAFGLSEIGSRGGGLAGVSELNNSVNDGYAKLMTEDANAKMGNMKDLMNARSQVAGYKDQEFQFNKVDPYYEGIARKQARTAALFQNLNNAASMGMGGMGGGGKSYSGGSEGFGAAGGKSYSGYGGDQNMYATPDGSEFAGYGNVG